MLFYWIRHIKMPNLQSNLTHKYSHMPLLPSECTSMVHNNAAHVENFIYDHRHKMLINFFNMIYLIVFVYMYEYFMWVSSC